MNKNLQNNLIFLKLIIENIILIILRKRIDIIIQKFWYERVNMISLRDGTMQHGLNAYICICAYVYMYIFITIMTHDQENV